MKTKEDYYKRQLDKINYHSTYCPIIKIQGGEEDQATKWMDVNKESAQVLINKLKKEFNL